MNSKRFDTIAIDFCSREMALLKTKRADYAEDDDCLMNFHQVSSLIGVRPEQYCMMLGLKHIQSILRAVADDRYDWTWSKPDGEGLKQHISDARNYLLLAAAIIDEKMTPKLKEAADAERP
jgi:hypothetical protein